jgi:preprotein translocase subunit Sss1
VADGLVPMTRGRKVATVLGLVYSVIGIVGFAVSGFDAFAAPRGDVLLGFTVNPLQNLIHLAIGWWLVNAAQAGEAEARKASVRAAALILIIGVAGLYLDNRAPELDFLNVNGAVNVAHLVSAIAAFFALAHRRVASAA